MGYIMKKAYKKKEVTKSRESVGAFYTKSLINSILNLSKDTITVKINGTEYKF